MLLFIRLSLLKPPKLPLLELFNILLELFNMAEYLRRPWVLRSFLRQQLHTIEDDDV